MFHARQESHHDNGSAFAYRRVADGIVRLVADGRLPLGAPVPSERELSTCFDVEPATIREALLALELEGVIHLRTGYGFVVVTHDAKPSRRSAGDPGPFEILQARRLVESEVAAMAASRGTAAHFVQIRKALQLMVEEIGATGNCFVADGLFHARVAEAAGNGALTQTVRQLWGYRRGQLFRKLDEHFDTLVRHVESVEEHRAIAEAIERRDPDAARNAMMMHIDSVNTAMSADWGRVVSRASPR